MTPNGEKVEMLKKEIGSFLFYIPVFISFVF